MIYLDYNATTPVHPEIRKFFLDWLDIYGNPSSLHSLGRKSSSMISESRNSILEALSLIGYHLLFTSGGTESNHLAFSQLVKVI